MTPLSTLAARFIRTLFWIITGLGCLATLLGFAGRWGWLFELASHFRMQYLVVLASGSMVLLAARRYRLATVLAACAMVNLYVLVPLYIPGTATEPPANRLRIVSANILAENTQRTQLLDFIRSSDPDLVTLFEVSNSWLDAVAELEQRYPYSRVNAINGHFGSAIFSRYPIEWAELKRFARISHYAVVARININGAVLHLIGAHVIAPMKNSSFKMRNTHLAELATTARQLPQPVMLIGDLNISTWSPYFQELQRNTGLKDGRPGFGIQATWPVGQPLLRIPIDHCLVSPAVEIHNWVRGPDIGSDHFPFMVDFSLPAPARQAPRRDTHAAVTVPAG